MAKKAKVENVAGRDVPQENNVITNEMIATEQQTHVMTENEVKKENIVASYSASKVEVMGDKMALTVEGVGKIIIPKSNHKLIVTELPNVGKVVIKIDKIKDKPGRPVDPLSPRQIALRQREERQKQLGDGTTLRQGRPVDPNSERQARLAEMEANFRSKIEVTPEAIELMKQGKTKDEAIDEVIASKKYAMKRGRPADKNSANFKKNQEREQRMLEYGGKLPVGRPKQNPDEVLEVEAPIVVSVNAEVELEVVDETTTENEA